MSEFEKGKFYRWPSKDNSYWLHNAVYQSSENGGIDTRLSENKIWAIQGDFIPWEPAPGDWVTVLGDSGEAYCLERKESVGWHAKGGWWLGNEDKLRPICNRAPQVLHEGETMRECSDRVQRGIEKAMMLPQSIVQPDSEPLKVGELVEVWRVDSSIGSNEGKAAKIGQTGKLINRGVGGHWPWEVSGVLGWAWAPSELRRVPKPQRGPLPKCACGRDEVVLNHDQCLRCVAESAHEKILAHDDAAFWTRHGETPATMLMRPADRRMYREMIERRWAAEEKAYQAELDIGCIAELESEKDAMELADDPVYRQIVGYVVDPADKRGEFFERNAP